MQPLARVSQLGSSFADGGDPLPHQSARVLAPVVGQKGETVPSARDQSFGGIRAPLDRSSIARLYAWCMALVDVVVVSYNSRDHLRAAVQNLSVLDDIHVIVVDNASADGSLDAVAGLPVEVIALSDNGGFARGSNVGWRAGAAPYVLLLNPDGRIDEASLRHLVTVLETHPRSGAVAPRIVHPDGSLAYSLRRFPRVRTTFAQALFLHRLFPRASWTDELVRDVDAYGRPATAEWVSGACVLVRRTLLEELDGLDEGFFLYSEDIDLCRRIWDADSEVRYEPGAVCVHVEGASTPRGGLLPVLARSRIRYARKHLSRWQAFATRLGVGLGSLTHLMVSRGGLAVRAGHARALGPVVARGPRTT
jgi:N-acetylglucosaminyl-diphospho-decaprenol L-rhamnosyltransferase